MPSMAPSETVQSPSESIRLASVQFTGSRSLGSTLAEVSTLKEEMKKGEDGDFWSRIAISNLAKKEDFPERNKLEAADKEAVMRLLSKVKSPSLRE